MTFSRYARLYFLPTAFIATPFGRDGEVARLAGGLIWFSAYEVIAVEAGVRVASQLVPVPEIDAFIATLADDQVEAARRTIGRITAARLPFGFGGRTLRLDQPQIMLILNMTPDSFSDGGAHNDDEAAGGSALASVEAGAALVDVGGESTRPGAKPVWEGDEIARVEPVVRRLAQAGAIVSIDTRKGAVMAAALDAGAAIVNDVSALSHDPAAAALLAARDCPVVLMHHQGDPATMQQHPNY